MSEHATVQGEKIQSPIEKLTALFNEEIYLRQDPGSIPVTKFKILDDLIESYQGNGHVDEAKEKIQEHLKDYPDSIFARYLHGIVSLVEEKVEDMSVLRSLLEVFKNYSKWTVVEHIADKILKFGDQRLALKYKAEALEKLNKNKELKPVLEKLARQDRKNPEVAKKYALSILHEDENKAMVYLKQAAEYFVRAKDYSQLDEIWPTIVEHSYEDIQFIEKIERILVSNREKARIVILLFPIIEIYKQYEDVDNVIFLLKKVLDHEPLSQKARNELIKWYKVKYQSHSLLDEFLKISEIGNNKKPIKACINNFERNIVFDTNNYVLHRNWGVGKIVSISSETDSIYVDFKDKENHKLSIQMAINSLKPLKKDHIWVQYYENPDEINALFQNDVAKFMVMLLTSQDDNKMVLSEIKTEVVEKFLKKSEDWSKWWTKAKQALKKDPFVGFNPKKKDEVIYRSKPITLSEELTEKFNALTDLNKKLDIALDALKDIEAAEDAFENFLHFYLDEENSKDPLRKILAYIFLDLAVAQTSPEEIPRMIKPQEMSSLIQSLEKEELLKISQEITNVEIKKEFVQIVLDSHSEAISILLDILYEVPIKVNKHVFSLLVSEKKFDELNQFIQNVMEQNKNYPEIFLWIAKSILTKSWNYEWLKISIKDLSLKLFRFLKPLVKIEPKVPKLKNSAMDIIFGSKNATLKDIISNSDNDTLRKFYVLFKEVSYINDPDKDKFLNLITESNPGFQWEDTVVVEEDEEDDINLYLPESGVLVTRKAYNERKEKFEYLVNVEMPENSRDIGEAQEKGDLRENAEYKAAMERQVQLRAELTKLEAELKSAKIIDLSDVKTSRIHIGCRVKLKNSETQEELNYAILGPWDTDTEKSIISYQSPLGMALLGKKQGDSAIVDFDGSKTEFLILEISRYTN